ncbi:MAG: Elongation factor 1-alpha [Methanonatronarchaeales archaeon]|nr:Elongation factor 1-alpha [Methanonatronarchaeales archaeon]
MDLIRRLAAEGEGGNVEFKERLKSEVHLSEDRRQSLAAQMKNRVLLGEGRGLYLVGVDDDGELLGISTTEMEESLRVLSTIADDLDLGIDVERSVELEGGFVALAAVEEPAVEGRKHLIVGTAGHVDHGKSSLVGSLITGEPDDGRGRTRIFLDVKPHEIERGLSADLSYGVYGFSGSETLNLANPLDRSEKASLIERSDKVVSFIDTVGHEPWLRTAIRGLLGGQVDYGLLAVDSTEGVTRVTREHLGIMLAQEIPVVVALTKVDRVDGNRVEEMELEAVRLVKKVGKVPYRVSCVEDVRTVLQQSNREALVPLFRTSAVTMEGLNLLNEFLLRAERRDRPSEKPFKMYIDRVYSVRGVGRVVSGTVQEGSVETGDTVLLGPDSHGNYDEVRVKSVEMHHRRVEWASAGQIVGIATKGGDPERGMVLCGEEAASAVREFEAEVMVLNHPTRISDGYEPVVHLETISEATRFIMDDYLVAGESGTVKMRFRYRPYCVTEGQRFVFREGASKGVGRVTRPLPE